MEGEKFGGGKEEYLTIISSEKLSVRTKNSLPPGNFYSIMQRRISLKFRI
jgi:hypothetical protein